MTTKKTSKVPASRAAVRLEPIVSCPCCGEPREHFEVTTWVDVNEKDCVTESCGWCGSSYMRETLDGHTGKSPKAANAQAHGRADK